MSDKLELKEKLQAVDLNVRELWDSLSEEGQKDLKNDLFRLNRYISNVKGQPRDIQEHFVLSVNFAFNKNFYALQKHPKLLWMLLCMCSYKYGQKTFYHEWIGNKKKDASNDNKKIKFLAELYPNMKLREVEMLASMYTDKEIVKLGKEYGFEDNVIKKKLK